MVLERESAKFNPARNGSNLSAAAILWDVRTVECSGWKKNEVCEMDGKC